ncbi:unnamed protein product [Rotaria sp. Silwood1]|nr:unnamed protein product [Rotaria sp. Silwood1]CAF1631142.1 unnamed protein product [Rotaria sp. Silwood1]
MNEIIQTLHVLKYFYWIVGLHDRNGFKPKDLDGNRPTREQIIEMRRYMLLCLKQLVIIHEDDNRIDESDMAVNLMSEHPRTMVPAFDRRQGLRTVFKLLASGSEITRLQALKLLGFFLQRSTVKRKTDTMQPYNLFSLLADRLLLHPNSFTTTTYNVLFEILVEKVSGLVKKRSSEITADWKIKNPAMIKVIATLLRNEADNIHLYDIKLRFLDDLVLLAFASRENRRTILQMSVWQDYLFGLAYVYPAQEIQFEITDRVFDLLKILLHHTIKYEYGGWRITKEDYYRKVNKIVESMKDDDENEPKVPITPRKLSGSQTSIDEQTASTPTSNDSTKSITETINNPDNQIFCANVIHIISQKAYVLCNACSGLLPLFASAISASHEIELLENMEGLSPKDALKIKKRVMNLSGLFILANTGNFSKLE